MPPQNPLERHLNLHLLQGLERERRHSSDSLNLRFTHEKDNKRATTKEGLIGDLCIRNVNYPGGGNLS